MASWRRALLGAAAFAALAITGTVGLALATGASVDPFCSQSTESMGAEKLSFFQSYCQRMAKATKVAPPRKAGPSNRPAPTAEEKMMQMKANAEYGIGEPEPSPDWVRADYRIRNVWLGEDNIVYLGELKSDPSVGVAIVASRFVDPVPKQLGVYTTKDKDGALHVVSATGSELVITAENGAKYTFNVDTRILTRN